jgi:uncharacterized protein (TIGR00252 family)
LSMTNYSKGHEAEKQAARFLERRSYKILQTNWRTRYCEIDIVAKHKKKIYFIEVKYRKNDLQGTGFEYITPTKQEQMRFAAELWVQENDWSKDYGLGAIELTGEHFEVTNYLSELD